MSLAVNGEPHKLVSTLYNRPLFGSVPLVIVILATCIFYGYLVIRMPLDLALQVTIDIKSYLNVSHTARLISTIL